jgi:hypothetical protein
LGNQLTLPLKPQKSGKVLFSFNLGVLTDDYWAVVLAAGKSE